MSFIVILQHLIYVVRDDNRKWTLKIIVIHSNDYYNFYWINNRHKTGIIHCHRTDPVYISYSYINSNNNNIRPLTMVIIATHRTLTIIFIYIKNNCHLTVANFVTDYDNNHTRH